MHRFFPVEKKVRYVPPVEDIDKVLTVPNPDTRDCLRTIKDTMGRLNEINSLKWEEVDFRDKCAILYTRKKKGGHLTPSKVPMTQHLYEHLFRRFSERNKSIPWVFRHTYTMNGEKKVVPFKDRRILGHEPRSTTEI